MNFPGKGNVDAMIYGSVRRHANLTLWMSPQTNTTLFARNYSQSCAPRNAVSAVYADKRLYQL